MTRKAEKHTETLAKGLAGLLADTYVLRHSTQACHWNVVGPQFRSLHNLFEEQYEELDEAIDTIAERIRGLDYQTPGTLGGLQRLTRIHQPEDLRTSKTMLAHLIEANQQVIHRANEVRGMAEVAMDEATADLLIERLRVHEKAVWMLRSQAGHESIELKSVTATAKAS